MIGAALRSARTNKGLTLREAARRLSTDAAIVSKIENGLRPPTLVQLQQMADLYDIDARPLRVHLIAAKISTLLKGEPQAGEILQKVSEELNLPTPDPMHRLLQEMESLKQMIGKPS